MTSHIQATTAPVVAPRLPTAYQTFVKTENARLKTEIADFAERRKRISQLWTEHKQAHPEQFPVKPKTSRNIVTVAEGEKQPIAKRAPTAYQEFVKAERDRLKDDPEFKALNPRDRVRRLAELWRAQKGERVVAPPAPVPTPAPEQKCDC